MAEAEKAGAKVVLMTPPPFDPVPIRTRLLLGGERFSYMKPYEGYDDVLARYAQWLLRRVLRCEPDASARADGAPC